MEVVCTLCSISSARWPLKFFGVLDSPVWVIREVLRFLDCPHASCTCLSRGSKEQVGQRQVEITC